MISISFTIFLILVIFTILFLSLGLNKFIDPLDQNIHYHIDTPPFNEKTTLKDLRENVIPKRIIQTYQTRNMPQNMFLCTHMLKQHYKNSQFFFFDDEQCRTFLLEHNETKALKAFDMIKPGAFKADIFRLAALYHIGGVYLDICFNLENDYGNLFDHLHDKEFLLCFELKPNKPDKPEKQDPKHPSNVYQAILAAPRYHRYTRSILDFTVDRILTQQYKKNDIFYLSGPKCFADAWNQIPNKDENKVLFCYVTRKNDDARKIVVDKKPLFKVKYRYWRTDREIPHYSQFKHKDIFNTEHAGMDYKETK